jgi:hypothetical protein
MTARYISATHEILLNINNNTPTLHQHIYIGLQHARALGLLDRLAPHNRALKDNGVREGRGWDAEEVRCWSHRGSVESNGLAVCVVTVLNVGQVRQVQDGA